MREKEEKPSVITTLIVFVLGIVLGMAIVNKIITGLL